MRDTAGYAVMLKWTMSNVYGLSPGDVSKVQQVTYCFLWSWVLGSNPSFMLSIHVKTKIQQLISHIIFNFISPRNVAGLVGSIRPGLGGRSFIYLLRPSSPWQQHNSLRGWSCFKTNYCSILVQIIGQDGVWKMIRVKCEVFFLQHSFIITWEN